MLDEQGDKERGAQEETPAEREAKKRPLNQDLEQPPEGRDQPPAETVAEGKRDSKSPWMGGG